MPIHVHGSFCANSVWQTCKRSVETWAQNIEIIKLAVPEGEQSESLPDPVLCQCSDTGMECILILSSCSKRAEATEQYFSCKSRGDVGLAQKAQEQG